MESQDPARQTQLHGGGRKGEGEGGETEGTAGGTGTREAKEEPGRSREGRRKGENKQRILAAVKESQIINGGFSNNKINKVTLTCAPRGNNNNVTMPINNKTRVHFARNSGASTGSMG